MVFLDTLFLPQLMAGGVLNFLGLDHVFKMIVLNCSGGL